MIIHKRDHSFVTICFESVKAGQVFTYCSEPYTQIHNIETCLKIPAVAVGGSGKMRNAWSFTDNELRFIDNKEYVTLNEYAELYPDGIQSVRSKLVKN